jgi:hypothetical protein
MKKKTQISSALSQTVFVDSIDGVNQMRRTRYFEIGRFSLRIGTLLIVTGILVACSSLHKKAKEQYESGDYEAALKTYNSLVKKNGNDDDAVIGLQKTREKLVDVGLLKVRKIRLQGRNTESLETFLELVSKENAWEFFPKDRVMFTQEEESKEAFAMVCRMADDARKKSQPLRASFILRRYEPIFQGQLLKQYEQKKAEVAKQGEGSCMGLADGSLDNKPFLAGFLKKYCAHWGVAHRNIAKSENSKIGSLFRDVGLDIEIAGIRKEALADFKEEVSWGLRQSPWYDPTAKNLLKVTLRGAFQNKHTKQSVPRTHNYTVSVPYTNYVTVQKSRLVPVTKYQQQCSSSYGYQTCYNVPYTAYETEYYSETEPRIAYRQVPQVQPYLGYTHDQQLSIGLDGVAVLNGKTLSFKMAEDQHEQSFSHDTNMPSIGLYPEEAELEDPLMFVKYQARDLSKRFEISLKNEWKARYCGELEKKPAASFTDGDNVIRCLKVTQTDPPANVQKWFLQNFGITTAQVDAILGLNERR